MKSMVIVSMLAVAGTAMGQYMGTGAEAFDVRQPAVSMDLRPDLDRVGTVVPFNVAGIQSWDAPGGANNHVAFVDLAAALGLPAGSQVTMTGVGWDVTLQAFGASWLSEIGVTFGPDNDIAQINLRPGAAQTNTGGNQPVPFSSGGTIKFDSIPLPNIVLHNGILRMEFFESYDDAAGVIDGQWVSGALFIQAVPAPGAMALLGFAGVAAARRRR